ncbi:MAG: FtsX-like permease family protein [Acidimicrobiales bacterium]
MTLWRFVAHQLRATRARAAVLGVGLLVAAVGFSLLSSESVSSAVTVQGTLNSNFRPAYDILVRPPGTRTALEAKDRLVNDGFLSNLYGGITLEQWHTILHLKGVSVAAPIENVGYFLDGPVFRVNLKRLVHPTGQELLRVVPSLVVHGGLASYPQTTEYFYYSNDKWVISTDPASPVALQVPGVAKPIPACPPYVTYTSGQSLPSVGPFNLKESEHIYCGGPHMATGGSLGGQYTVNPPGDASILEFYGFPVLLSAIDPVQEAKLVDLPTALLSGSYLREGEGISAPVPSAHGRQFHLEVRQLPVLVSSRTFVDEAFHVVVQRLAVPSGGPTVAERLASKDRAGYLAGLSGPTVLNRTYPTADLYKSILAGLNRTSTGFGGYWTAGGVAYRTLGHLRLAALPTTNPLSVWEPTSATSANGTEAYAPPGGNATQFRKLSPYNQSGTVVPQGAGNVYVAPEGVIQGTFDPAKLPGFAPLSKVPLGTFFPPTLTGATPAARAKLGDRPLGPTTNIGGYLGQPPLFLTTLKAAAPFFDSSTWTGLKPRRAPIASIQVRVSDLHGANRASIHRVEQVANEIHQATHLQVDITAGSSPTPVDIALPAGGFGQPALQVQQGWVKKGVATIVLDAANSKDLALFVLILVVAGLFVVNASVASVRQRRGEIATLVTLGWGRRQVFAAVLSELAIIGVAAGVAGAGVAAIVIGVAGLHFTVLRVVLVIPAAFAVAVAAGAVPAWQASRLSPLEGMAPPVRTAAAGRRVRSVTHLGLVNLTRIPGRTLLGGFGLVVGVAALAFLLGVQSAFSGAVAGNLLGDHIDVQVRGADYAAVVIILALGAGSVTDVLIMNLRERSGELAALRACGWADRSLRHLVVTEGVTIGLVGSLIGAAAGLGAVTAFGAAPASVAAGTAATFAAGTALCAAAVLPALSVLTRQLPAVSLASE